MLFGKNVSPKRSKKKKAWYRFWASWGFCGSIWLREYPRHETLKNPARPGLGLGPACFSCCCFCCVCVCLYVVCVILHWVNTSVKLLFLPLYLQFPNQTLIAKLFCYPKWLLNKLQTNAIFVVLKLFYILYITTQHISHFGYLP